MNINSIKSKFYIFYFLLNLISCVQSGYQLNDSGSEFMNLLLFEKNMYQMDTNSKWQVSGVLLKSDTTPLASATVALASKVPLRVAIDTSTTTDAGGRFTMNLKSGAITLKVTDANGLPAGTLELSISNQGTISGRPGEGSSFTVSTISTIYVYPSGATTPLSISSLMYKSFFEYSYSRYAYNYIYPGATVFLDLEILNNTDKSINGIDGSLSSNSPFVSITRPNCSSSRSLIGNLSPGYYQSTTRRCRGNLASTSTNLPDMTNPGSSSNYYVLNISSELPPNTNLEFSLTLTDLDGKTYSIPFNILTTSESPSLTLSNWNFISNGSASSQILPGDRVFINPIFYNSGNIPLKDLNVSLSSSSPHIQILSNQNCSYNRNIGSLPPSYYQSYYNKCYGYSSSSYQPSSSMSTYSSSYYLSFNILDSAPSGTTIPLTVIVSDLSGKEFLFTIQVTVANYSKSITLNSNNIVTQNGSSASRFYPGDTLYLNPIFYNAGNIRVNAIKGYIESNSPHVTVNSPSCNVEMGNIEKTYYQNFYNRCYNYITSGNYYSPTSSINLSYAAAYFKVVISNSAPSGSVIPIVYKLIDASGQEFLFNFSISINTYTSSRSMNLISNNSILTNGNSTSNLYPGDSLYLNPIFQSTGFIRLNSVNATLTSTSNLVSIVNPTCSSNMGNIDPGNFQNYFNRCFNGNSNGSTSSPSSNINLSYATYYFRVTLNNTIPSGTVVPMTYTVLDSSGNMFSFNFTLTVTNYTSNQQTFTFSGNTISPLTGNWIISSTNCHSGNCIKSAAIGHNGTTSVTYSGSGFSRISFYWRVSSESGYDYCKFYIDNVLQDSISGTSMSNHALVSKTTSLGFHTLKWEYSKDYIIASGLDACFVDTINLF